MKKILALMLAVVMAASMTVAAMAEETTAPDAPPATETPDAPDTPEGPDAPETPDTPETPDEPVEEEAPITLDKRRPGEEISLNWNINALGNTQSLLAKMAAGVKLVDYYSDKDEVNLRDEIVNEDSSQVWIKVRLNNTNIGPEDYDKIIKDTIHLVLDNGKTYSFPLTIGYDAGAKLEVKSGDRNHFILGEESSFVMTMLDPEGVFPLPYEVKIVQQTANGTQLPEENKLLEIKSVEQDGKDFTVTVKGIRVGRANMVIYVTDADGHVYGQGQSIEVSSDGNFHKPSSIKDLDANKTDNQRAEEAAVDVIDKVNEAIAAGEELPAKAQTVETATGSTSTVVPVKLHGLEASLSVDTMDLLAYGKVGIKANINNGAAEIILPNGFQHTPEPGRFGYPLGFQKDPRDAELMKSAVKEEDAKTEAYKLGGNVVLPTTATVTIKTKLDGKVNIYYWNDETRKYTLLATPTAEDGKVTFATKQLGHLLVTTGTV